MIILESLTRRLTMKKTLLTSACVLSLLLWGAETRAMEEHPAGEEEATAAPTIPQDLASSVRILQDDKESDENKKAALAIIQKATETAEEGGVVWAFLQTWKPSLASWFSWGTTVEAEEKKEDTSTQPVPPAEEPTGGPAVTSSSTEPTAEESQAGTNILSYLNPVNWFGSTSQPPSIESSSILMVDGHFPHNDEQ
jgi:hypothetical protein